MWKKQSNLNFGKKENGNQALKMPTWLGEPPTNDQSGVHAHSLDQRTYLAKAY
jgi:hypothetical protein